MVQGCLVAKNPLFFIIYYRKKFYIYNIYLRKKCPFDQNGKNQQNGANCSGFYIFQS
nr:MAG TPA: hypothetical protein [Caudoviricetes sp.]